MYCSTYFGFCEALLRWNRSCNFIWNKITDGGQPLTEEIVLRHNGTSESGTDGEVKYGCLYNSSLSVSPVYIYPCHSCAAQGNKGHHQNHRWICWRMQNYFICHHNQYCCNKLHKLEYSSLCSLSGIELKTNTRCGSSDIDCLD